jgi:hypothetical protein
MRAVDDFLIDRVFQPAVNWCGRMFGWTQWGIARQANYAALACVIIFNGMRLLSGVGTIWIAISLGIYMLWFVVITIKLWRHSSMKDGASRFRLTHVFLRVLFASVPFVMIPVDAALNGFQSLGWPDLKITIDVICLYAMACADPPPKEVRQFRLAHAGAS